MIIGIGIDIVDTRRIDSILKKFESQFTDKILTEHEVSFCKARTNLTNSIAKMFAIKEAMIKALSDAHGIRWHEIEISHNADGKPEISLSGTALKNLETKAQRHNIQVSTSDERDYAIAYVVIESL